MGPKPGENLIYKKDIDVLQHPKKGNKADERSREKSCEEWLKELEWFNLEEEGSGETLLLSRTT